MSPFYHLEMIKFQLGEEDGRAESQRRECGITTPEQPTDKSKTPRYKGAPKALSTAERVGLQTPMLGHSDYRLTTFLSTDSSVSSSKTSLNSFGVRTRGRESVIQYHVDVDGIYSTNGVTAIGRISLNELMS